jgi:hypothetical protein
MQSHSALLSTLWDESFRPSHYIHIRYSFYASSLKHTQPTNKVLHRTSKWSCAGCNITESSPNYSGISLPLIWLVSGSLSGYRLVLKMKDRQSYKTTDQSWTIITFCVRNAWRHVIFWKLRAWQWDWIRFVRISVPPPHNPLPFQPSHITDWCKFKIRLQLREIFPYNCHSERVSVMASRLCLPPLVQVLVPYYPGSFLGNINYFFLNFLCLLM